MKLRTLLCAIAAGWSLASAPLSAQDLLGDTRANILRKFGSPQFHPRLGDEQGTEQFHVGDYFYTIGYRFDRDEPNDDAKKKVICVLKSRDRSHPATMQPDEIRGALDESRGKPQWTPYRPLPAEDRPRPAPNQPDPDPGADQRDFSTDNNDRDSGVRTASGRTGGRRQRVLTYTSEWHGIPDRVLDLRLLALPPEALAELFQGFDGNAVQFMTKNKKLPEKFETLLKQEAAPQ